MGSATKQVSGELLPFLRVFKDGSVEPVLVSQTVPPSPEDPQTGVSSKDITISKDPPISARLFLPKLSQPAQKLPILVYFHGGGFCTGSAFSLNGTRYMNSLVSQAKVVGISVEYRLAPEHPLPIAYEDCWTALQWVASHSIPSEEVEEWISKHGDFSRLFIGGDSAGANIAHNMAMRVGSQGLKNDVKLLGFYLTHPYFWGSKAVGSESVDRKLCLPYKLWSFLYPSVAGGIDSPLMNPVAAGGPSLAGLAGSRLLISVSEKDLVKDRGILYYNSVKESGWEGELELIEVEGEVHAFHILNFGTKKANNLIQRLASFLLK